MDILSGHTTRNIPNSNAASGAAHLTASTWMRPFATRFARRTQALRSDTPLAEDQMRQVAPSIFAEGKHASRSERYTYIPTIDVLRSLRKEGFQPFMVAQGASRIEGKAEFTKHLIRMRFVGSHLGDHMSSDGLAAKPQPDAHEIILINSHDGASAYQLLSGIFRSICLNGLVVGKLAHDIRIAHKGQAQAEVIEGAIRVLDDAGVVAEAVDGMKALALSAGEEHAFASAALSLRYGEAVEGQPLAPVSVSQIMEPRRVEDVGHSLWLNLQRVQEHLIRGGQRGRSVQGKRLQTRAVTSIDRSVNLNRALWTLAEEMRRLKA
jgi:Domain of unknown function (DUF932)